MFVRLEGILVKFSFCLKKISQTHHFILEERKRLQTSPNKLNSFPKLEVRNYSELLMKLYLIFENNQMVFDKYNIVFKRLSI